MRKCVKDMVMLATAGRAEPASMIDAVAAHAGRRDAVALVDHKAAADAIQEDIDAIKADLDSGDPARVRRRAGRLDVTIATVRVVASGGSGRWRIRSTHHLPPHAVHLLDRYARGLLELTVDDLTARRDASLAADAANPHPSRMTKAQLNAAMRGADDARAAALATFVIVRRLISAGVVDPWSDIAAARRRLRQAGRCRRAVSRWNAVVESRRQSA